MFISIRNIFCKMHDSWTGSLDAIYLRFMTLIAGSLGFKTLAARAGGNSMHVHEPNGFNAT